MNENDPNAPNEEPIELARQVNTPSQPSVSNPRMQAVRSAARAQPLSADAKGPTSKRLKEGVIDTILNSVSILGEVLEDFRNSDRYFKYKALVLSAWFVLLCGSFGVACQPTGPSNDINAALVVTGDPSQPIYMITNDSNDVWEDVELIINGGQYRSTMSKMKAQGGHSTLSGAVLYDANGNRAPSSLVITDIVVKVSEPEAEVTLLKNGAVVK